MYKGQRKRYVRIGKHGWLLGLLGFNGLQYFKTHDPAMLFYFSFFSFFSFYFNGKLAAEMPDERYYMNAQKARSITMWVPAACLFIIGMGSMFAFGTREFMIIVSSAGWAATFLTYSITFYYLDKYC